MGKTRACNVSFDCIFIPTRSLFKLIAFDTIADHCQNLYFHIVFWPPPS